MGEVCACSFPTCFPTLKKCKRGGFQVEINAEFKCTVIKMVFRRLKKETVELANWFNLKAHWRLFISPVAWPHL